MLQWRQPCVCGQILIIVTEHTVLHEVYILIWALLISLLPPLSCSSLMWVQILAGGPYCCRLPSTAETIA